MTHNESSSAQQYLRLRRFAMAAGTYVLVLTLIGLMALGDFFRISLADLLWVGALVLASQLVFLALLLSGVNQRFADPSLTLPQVLVALAWFTLFLAQVQQARGTLLILYVVILLFGISQLTPRLFARCAALAFGSYACLVLVESYRQPLASQTLAEVLLQLGVLLLVLVWLSLFAGYVQAMRQRMQQRSVALQAHQDTLRGMMRQLESLVATDELTGLYNRRHFLRLAKRELAGLRPGREHGLALIDLDHFKSINDRFGHASGDRVLQVFAEVARTCLRDGDVLARYGGEEFLLLLPGSDRQQFAACCERLRQAYAQTRLAELGEAQVSLSIGMTMLRMGDDLDAALQRADQALYRAKHAGRNRCEPSWEGAGG